MRIVFMTPDEPLYLPDLYRYVFDNLQLHHEIKVVIVPPLYKKTTTWGLALRYAKTFGFAEAAALSAKVLFYKGMDIFPRTNNGKYYSLRSLFAVYGVSSVQGQDVNSTEMLNLLRTWGADLIISISCPQIFKRDLISLPSRGCLNLHGSPLPQYRGVMPSFWMLANGEQEAGSMLFFVNDKIDAGDVLIQRKFPIHDEYTLDSFIRYSKRVGAEMVVEAIEKIDSGKVDTTPLDMNKGNYYGWPTKEDVQRFRTRGRRFR